MEFISRLRDVEQHIRLRQRRSERRKALRQPEGGSITLKRSTRLGSGVRRRCRYRMLPVYIHAPMSYPITDLTVRLD
jgi:hypothetical protein